MSRPKVSDNGEIDIKSVESLSFDELRQWVRERLHGEDLVVPGAASAGEMPHYLLALLYARLN